MKIAFTTSTGEIIDQHFGQCQSFHRPICSGGTVSISLGRNYSICAGCNRGLVAHTSSRRPTIRRLEVAE